jgi:hypothetical protein
LISDDALNISGRILVTTSIKCRPIFTRMSAVPQFHYLKDIAKPVVDSDRKLKTELKISMRRIRDDERRIEQKERRC